MLSVLPSRILNYKVSAASPTAELITLGQILSEVGDYAASIIDSKRISLSRQCATRLQKVVKELISRQSIQSCEDLYKMPECDPATTDLAAMTIDELHGLYRRWPIRHQKRGLDGREHTTFFYEGQIVRELLKREAANKDEQLKIDYCVATYNNELDNMSLTFSLPVKVDDDKTYPDSKRSYSPDELTALIGQYRNYRDVIEREILIEYVDYALDLLERGECSTSMLPLVAEIARLGQDNTIVVPEWVYTKPGKVPNRQLQPSL